MVKRIQVSNREALEWCLLQILFAFPRGITSHDVYKHLETRYEFPDLWQNDVEGGGHPEIRWKNATRWARNELSQMNFLDESADRGMWKLSPEGIDQAQKSFDDYCHQKRKYRQPHVVNLDDLLDY